MKQKFLHSFLVFMLTCDVANGGESTIKEPSHKPTKHEIIYNCTNNKFNTLQIDLITLIETTAANQNFHIQETVCSYHNEFGSIIRTIVIQSTKNSELITSVYIAVWQDENMETQVSIYHGIDKNFTFS